MKLIINGKVCDTQELATVADLAVWLELPDFGSAVELNGEVIRRSDHESVLLHEGDRLEVVRLVGGG